MKPLLWEHLVRNNSNSIVVAKYAIGLTQIAFR